MFSEPITITVDGVAKVMPRVSSVGQKSLYQLPDGTFNLIIDHNKTKAGRLRHVSRFEERAVVVNPLDSSNDYDTTALTIIIERPEFGFSMDRVDDLLQAFKVWLTTATMNKLYGQES